VAAQDTGSTRDMARHRFRGVLACDVHRGCPRSGDSYYMLALGPDRVASRYPEMLPPTDRAPVAGRGKKTTFTSPAARPARVTSTGVKLAADSGWLFVDTVL
jgi:hypothetical protein